MEVRLHERGTGSGVALLHAGELVATVPAPLHVVTGPSTSHRAGYETVEEVADRLTGATRITVDGVRISVTDIWSALPDGAVELVRHLAASSEVGASTAGVQLRLDVDLEAPNPRFFAPGMAYAPSQWSEGGNYSYADHRLAYPVVAAWCALKAEALSLERVTQAAYDAAPTRDTGQSVFAQATDVGSVGFRAGAAPGLLGAWPYAEIDHSAMLDAARTPAVALHPVPPDGLDVTVTYLLRRVPAADYVEAVRAVFGATMSRVSPEPTPLPVPLVQSIDLRLDSASQTYTVFDDGFAGFVVNFDPDRGYDSQARAFGASFADHHMGGSRGILEYGFTGRQLNLAAMLARRAPHEWGERAAAVVDSFVERMATPSGWVHTLWDANRGRPLFACGDQAGTVMHYLGASDVPGTYTRMMTEAGSDLLLNVDLRAPDDAAGARWWAAAKRLGDFFLRVQEPDGSWFRAYSPDGEPLFGEWFGSRADASGKSATGAVVPFILEVADRADEPAPFLAAAERAARFILDQHTSRDEYRGGTLDNPNVVDKEAAFIAMRALMSLHRRQPDPALLEGARRAAVLAVTWHSIWQVPHVAGTRLATEDVRSVGWGGINPVWGVGVTDIYSNFFLADLHDLGIEVQDQLFVDIARLAAHSSIQLLAVPGDLHGFADTGMQPEGISFCSQGMDDGLITKGDTWGGLGWPYTAGTHALDRYLATSDPEHDQHSPTGSRAPSREPSH